MRTKKIGISGMTCANCQQKIQKKLRNTAGVRQADVDWASGTAVIAYDTDIISSGAIAAVIEKLGYDVTGEDGQRTENTNRIAGLLVLIVALYLLLERFGVLNLMAPSRLAEAGMGYGMLFVIGLVTSVHCVAMCGGLSLTQCIPPQGTGQQGASGVLLPSLLYNLGRVISYTAAGFLVGALGSVISFSNATQGALKLVAGVFMLIMGLNLLGVFPWLRALNPRLPGFLSRKADRVRSGRKSPLVVGLLNGLMPCGPLQAMQLYALSTGSAFAGALSMFLFSLGTVPLMFALGAVSSALGRKFTQKAMAAGAVLVAVLGLGMLSQGWSLLGSGTVPTAAAATGGPGTLTEGAVQVVNSTLSRRGYPAITVQAGVPVRWVIDAPEGSINGCNNRMYIGEYGIEHQFQTGENIIEFTPVEAGTFRYSCWMGMIRSTITVLEADGTEVPAETPSGGDSGQRPALGATASLEPEPSDYVIPSDELAVAAVLSEGGAAYQTVTIEVTDQGIRPAVVVVEYGLETLWVINNTASSDSALLIPAYYTELALAPGETPVYLYPTESFDFSNGSQTLYGFVKVVDDIGSVDLDAVKAEAGSRQVFRWPAATFQTGEGGASCH